MKKQTIFILLLLLFSRILVNEQLLDLPDPIIEADPVIAIDVAELQSNLRSLNQHRNKTNSSEHFAIIDFPQADGTVELFEITTTQVLPLNLQEEHPTIQTYQGHSISHPDKSIRFTLSELGIIGLMRSEGKITFIEPKQIEGDAQENLYVYKINPSHKVTCLGEHTKQQIDLALKDGNNTLNGSQRITFDIAVAATGEFTTQNGGSGGATAAIISMLNMVNEVYQNDLGIRLQLAANNSNLIFTNPNTDPFTNTDPFDSNANFTNQAQTGITSTIGTSSYDLGHVFHFIPPIIVINPDTMEPEDISPAGTGLAGIGVTCNNNLKAGAWSAYGTSGGFGALFDIVVHEIAHQFSATHTFYGTDSNCNQKSAATSYEPGSGTTIMAYTGICGVHNIGTFQGDYYFHAASIDQINDYVGAVSCGTPVASGNTSPVANAGPDYIIPVNTPFELEGIATDADGDRLTYCWEQFNTDGSFSNTHPNQAANFAGKPLFRSFLPTENPIRTFPQLSDIINGTQTIGEILSKVAQTATFRLTVRDNSRMDGTSVAGGTDCDDMTVQFVGNANSNPNAGFFITNPNSNVTWTSGNNTTITWNTGTSNGSLVNCNNVDIWLSTNNGASFDYLIASNVNNDGNHTLQAPYLPSSASTLLKLKCSDNIFFDISDTKFLLENTSCAANGSNFTPDAPVTANYGSSNLNLNLNTQFGTPQTSTSQTTNANTPTMTLTAYDGVACTFFSGNNPHYKAFEFYVDTDGQYIFTFASSSAWPRVMNLYKNNFNPNSSCQNWIASNAISTSPTQVNIANQNFGVNLERGTKYILAVSGFLNDDVGTYTVNFSNSIGGNIYDGVVPPGSGYAYTYAAVDANGNIAAISSNSNFTALSSGNYTVYGLSYQSSSLSNPNSLIGNSFSSVVNDFLTGTYCGNFSSNRLNLEILCPTGNCGNSTYPESYQLQAGWNMISTSCILEDSDLDVIWNDISSAVIQMKDLNGTYAPAFNFNSIGDWDLPSGYLVKMASPQTITFDCIDDIDYINNSINLDDGWNLVAYWGNTPIDADVALASISANIIQAKDLTGTYAPAFGFNSLDNGSGLLYPGRAIQIKMDGSDVLTYPNGLGKSEVVDEETPFLHPTFYVNEKPVHPNNMILAFPDVNNAPLNTGDEIGVFSAKGNLLGSGVYNGQPLAIMLYDVDPLETENIESEEGKIYEVRAWSKTTQLEQILELEVIKGNKEFHTNAYTEVAFKSNGGTNATGITSTIGQAIQLFPNPSKGVISLELVLENQQDIVLELMDTKGKQLRQQTYSFAQGKNTAQFDLHDLADGVYFFKLTDETKQQQFLRFVLMQ